MKAAMKLIDTAQKWNGYLEKKSNKDLDSFTENAGSNNYTCFARDYHRDTGRNLQAQPWCAMYVSEMFVQAFGLQAAKKLLCGSLYHYCPDGVNQFKAAGRWYKIPEPGDVIFFTNVSRAYHTGIVTEVTASRVKTIEGNTSGASGVIENGGGVCKKSYALIESKIMGYGRPDWNIVQPTGWIEDEYGWWYRHDDGSYTHDGWEQISGKWYWFNADGYAYRCQWVQDKGQWYYLGADNAMVKGFQAIDGKVYYFDESGAMAEKRTTVEIVPDERGALH